MTTAVFWVLAPLAAASGFMVFRFASMAPGHHRAAGVLPGHRGAAHPARPRLPRRPRGPDDDHTIDHHARLLDGLLNDPPRPAPAAVPPQPPSRPPHPRPLVPS